MFIHLNGNRCVKSVCGFTGGGVGGVMRGTISWPVFALITEDQLYNTLSVAH